ncbi:MAG: hypothetical protein ACFFFG_17300 [Candidatus Thorarchaeota archaeon]
MRVKYSNSITFLLATIITFLMIVSILSVPSNQNNKNEMDNGVLNDKIRDLSILHVDYKADGTQIERTTESNQVTTDTPGVANGNHPLGDDKMAIIGIDEIGFVMPTDQPDTGGNGYLIENAIANDPYSSLLASAATFSGKYILSTACGDVDGDNKDELVTVDKEGCVRIYSYDNTNQLLEVKEDSNGNNYSLDIIAQYATIELGQFNADPGLEIAITSAEHLQTSAGIQIWDPCKNDGTFYIPGTTEYARPTGPGGIAFAITDIDTEIIQDIEIGDFDNDNLNEIVAICFSGKYYHWELTIENMLVQVDGPEDIGANQGYPVNMPQYLATGDFDGDIVQDVVLMDCRYPFDEDPDEYQPYHQYLERVIWKYGSSTTTYPASGTMPVEYLWYPSIGAADIDGDGLSETIVAGIEMNMKDNWVVMIFDDQKHNFQKICHFTGTDCNWAAKSFDFCDVDLDSIPEIIFSSVQYYGNYLFGHVIPEVQDRDTKIVKYDPITRTMAVIRSPESEGMPVIGDFDGDGIMIEYSGVHFPSLMPNRPLFVLAAPPAYQGINDNCSYTSISSDTSTGSGYSEQFNIHAGLKISYGLDCQLFGLGVKVHSAFEFNYQLLHTETTTETETIGVQYVSGYDNNYVIYDAIDYESYVYRILTHPDPSMVGYNLSIDVPLDINVYCTSVTYYNNINSTLTSKIGSETFTHTIGQPTTYPSLTEVKELGPSVERIVEPPISVIMGEGIFTGSTLTYTRTEEKVTTEEHTWDFTVSAGVEVSGFGLDVSFGGGFGKGHQVIAGSSMKYQGAIAGISEEDEWNEKKYSFGLFIQNFQQNDGPSYQLIHYYTSGGVYIEKPSSESTTTEPSSESTTTEITSKSTTTSLGLLACIFALFVIPITIKSRKS